MLMAVILMVLGWAIGYSLSPKNGGFFGVIAAMAVWGIMVAVATAGGEKILLASTGAHEVDHDHAPQLYNIVEEMKIASGLPTMPKVYIIDSDAPNAFAVGLKPDRAAVAVTTGLLARLNRDELQGVIAHEIGHISNRDTLFMTMAGMTIGAIVLLADIYLRGMWITGGRRRSSSDNNQAAAIMAIVAIVLAILAPLLGQMLYFACSRKREYLADASGAQFTRYPEGLASALEKISGYHGAKLHVSKAVSPMFTINPLAAAGSARSLFSTHPPTADRIRILRGMSSASSLAAYEEAYKSTHGSKGVIGARSLAASEDTGIREASDKEKANPSAQLRAAKDILNRAAQYATIACACGLRIKLPPGFDRKEIKCPRCGRNHEVPSPELLAAAAAMQTVRIVRKDGDRDG